MKNLAAAFAHPLTQLISFCIILMNSRIWVAPYGWDIWYGMLDKQLFAFVGMAAVLVTLISCFILRRYLQPVGLILMWFSLAVFLVQLVPQARTALFSGALQLITHALFILITLLVIKKFLTWKNS